MGGGEGRGRGRKLEIALVPCRAIKDQTKTDLECGGHSLIVRALCRVHGGVLEYGVWCKEYGVCVLEYGIWCTRVWNMVYWSVEYGVLKYGVWWVIGPKTNLK